jgi:branched-chain amino acid aminotransferase
MTRVAWLNGKIVPETDATVSIYDSALMFGDSVFEFCRSFNRAHFKLDEHLARLKASCAAVAVTCPDEAVLREAIDDVTRLNEDIFEPDDEHRLYIFVSRGPLGIYKGMTRDDGQTVLVSDFQLSKTVAGMGRLFDCGVHAVVPAQRQIPSRLVDATIKHRSRLHFAVANQQVLQLSVPDAWALLLDEEGRLTEGTGANICIVQEDRILTPAQNCLQGISRNYIKELVPPNQYHEIDLGLNDLLDADEAFFTGTPFCLMPITRVNGQAIGFGAPGPVTKWLLREWGQTVGVDIVAQIQAWDSQRTEPVGSSVYVAK